MEADLLQHLASCPLLEEVTATVKCSSAVDDGDLVPCRTDLFLEHVQALAAACTRLTTLCLEVRGSDDDEDEPYPAVELLESLASLPALQVVRQGGVHCWLSAVLYVTCGYQSLTRSGP